MKFDPHYYADLVLRHCADDLDPEEKVILEDWCNQSPANRRIVDHAEVPYKFSSHLADVPDFDSEKCWEEIKQDASIMFGKQLARI